MPIRRQPNHRVIARADRPTIVFVTACVEQRQQLLANEVMHLLLREIWTESTAWLVGRYIMMPDHVHLFAAPGEPSLALTNWIGYWKRISSRRAGRALWQADYWDTTLRDQNHATEKWAYIEQNPVRAGLVTSTANCPTKVNYSSCLGANWRAFVLKRFAGTSGTGGVWGQTPSKSRER